MKRLMVFLIAALFTVIAIDAQSLTNVKRQQHSVSIATGLIDSLDLNEVEVQNVVLDLSAKNAVQLYSVYVSMEAGTASNDTAVTSMLQKSHDGVNYFDVDSVKYLITEDSVWIFEDIDTGMATNYLRIYNSMISVGDTCSLAGMEIKLYDK